MAMKWVALLAMVAKMTQGAFDPDNEQPVRAQDRCTSIVVGPKAGDSGPMNTQTADCSDCDFRIAKVPARDWPAGTMRPLYVIKNNYPAVISTNRGNTWDPKNLVGSPSQLAAWGTESPTTGHIPQVNHTFALYEGGYGIINEFQVAMGESTCPARFWAAPTIAGGKAMIEMSEMSKIALERSKTAREAIQTMGDLAVKYGFYAADWSGGDGSKGEGGEAMTVIDKTEAWIFHVTGDDTGTSAVWVAKRVPDGHIAAVANQFVIRAVDPGADDLMYSANLWEVAIRNKLWAEGDAPLDFLKTYGVARYHATYATRRVWRVFGLAAPSVHLPEYTNMWADDYPFSAPVDKVLTAQDLMEIQRDHYEGTDIDLTKGIAGGPYGDPNRWDVAPVDGLSYTDMLEGAFERSISLFRTSYSFVATARAAVPDSLALLWFSQYAPATTSYAPFYLNVVDAPTSYTTGSLFKYDPTISFWNFCAAGNYAGRFYKYAIGDIRTLQATLMDAAVAAVKQTEAAALALKNPSDLTALLTQTTNEQAALILNGWRDLLPQLITKYHDGYQALDLDKPDISMQSFFYPKFWLDATGYWDNRPNYGPGVIVFDPSPEPAGPNMIGVVMLTALVSSLLTALAGAYYVRNQNKNRKFQSNEYISINL